MLRRAIPLALALSLGSAAAASACTVPTYPTIFLPRPPADIAPHEVALRVTAQADASDPNISKEEFLMLAQVGEVIRGARPKGRLLVAYIRSSCGGEPKPGDAGLVIGTLYPQPSGDVLFYPRWLYQATGTFTPPTPAPRVGGRALGRQQEHLSQYSLDAS